MNIYVSRELEPQIAADLYEVRIIPIGEREAFSCDLTCRRDLALPCGHLGHFGRLSS